MGIKLDALKNSQLIQSAYLCLESNPVSVNVLRNALIPLNGRLSQFLQNELCDNGLRRFEEFNSSDSMIRFETTWDSNLQKKRILTVDVLLHA